MFAKLFDMIRKYGMSPDNVNLKVIIPSKGMDGLLAACLNSLYENIRNANVSNFEVIVVDNGSEYPIWIDKNAFNNFRIMRFDYPRSFSSACNVIRNCKEGTDLLFLNNDVFLHPQAISQYFKISKKLNLGICGSRLIYTDGTIQHCGIRFDEGQRGPYHEFHKTKSILVPRQIKYYQAVTGACLFIKKELFDDMNGFDENYPFGYEDVDLCLRARERCVKISCIQEYDSLHFGSLSNQRHDRHLESKYYFLKCWKGRYSIDGDIKDP